jgi:long-chain acyl-CoA synthetase
VPDRPAIIFGETTITYARLADSVDRLAAGLRNLGVEAGDRVALVMPNCPQFAMVYFATVRLGAVVVPFNPMLTPPEAGYIVADSGAKVIAAVGVTAPLAAAIAEQTPDLQHVIVSGDELPEGAISFEELLATEPDNLPDPPGAEDLAALIYTSGTTGKPKGAMLTHGNLICNAEACVEGIGLGDDDIMFATLPLFHSYGALACMILAVFAGVPLVVVPKFENLAALEALERGRVTFFPAVPSMFAMLAQVKTERDFDLSSLRRCLSGGAALSAEIAQAFEARWGCPILEGYGPTEASPVVSVNRSVADNKPGSVGPPLPGVEVDIRDDDDRPLPVGEVGEICVRGGNVMQGYWNDVEQTAATLKGEWLLTGDLGRVDEDGHIYIVDRKKDLIIVGGLNVYPREVEDCILEMPQVRDVAVIGMKTPLHGERVRACIELHEGEELDPHAVVEHCAGKLAHFKTPRWVDIFDQLPRTTLGKVLKRELRDIPTQRA